MRYVKQFMKRTNIDVLLKQLDLRQKIEQGDAEIDRLEQWLFNKEQ